MIYVEGKGEIIQERDLMWGNKSIFYADKKNEKIKKKKAMINHQDIDKK